MSKKDMDKVNWPGEHETGLMADEFWHQEADNEHARRAWVQAGDPGGGEDLTATEQEAGEAEQAEQGELQLSAAREEAEIERLHEVYEVAKAEEDSRVAGEIEQAVAAAEQLLGEDPGDSSTEEEGDIHEMAAERAGIRPELWAKAIEAVEQDKAASLDEALRNAGVGSRQRNRFFRALGQERARKKAGQQELTVEEPTDLSRYKGLPNAEERAKRRREMAGLMREAFESGDYDQFFRNPANRIRAGELGIKLPPLDPHGSNGSFSG